MGSVGVSAIGKSASGNSADSPTHANRSDAGVPVLNATDTLRSSGRIKTHGRALAQSLLIGLLTCFAISAIEAVSTASDDVAAAVHRLLDQLDSGELATRQHAEEQLVKLGPAALRFCRCRPIGLPPKRPRGWCECGERWKMLGPHLLRQLRL